MTEVAAGRQTDRSNSGALETLTLTLGKMMGGLGVTLFEAEDLVARTIVVDLRRLWGVHSWRRREGMKA